jgi:MacB-like periplasmic core domain
VSAGKNIVSVRYFTTMGIPLERGRSFSDADNEQSPRVAIVNRRLADVLWPAEDAIGRRFSQAGPEGPWLEVVGVTATGKYRFLFEDPQPYFYVPLAQEYSALRVLHVRSTLSPEVLAPTIEHEIHGLEPDLPLYDAAEHDESP